MQKMKVQMLNSDKVDKQLIEKYYEAKNHQELSMCFECTSDNEEAITEEDKDQFLSKKMS